MVAAPWLLRQLDEFGSISPSAANGRILWITEYAQLYSVTSETTLESFLSQGLGEIAWSRVGGLAFAIILFASLPLLFVLAPFLLVGIVARRRDRSFAPWLIYAVALFLFTALVSAVHVPFGTFIHSAVALVPHAYLLAIVGIAVVVGWVGSRRAGWDIPRATRAITAMLVAIVLIGSAGATLATMRIWEADRAAREPVLVGLAQAADRADVVMSADAGAYHYHGGWSGIVTPEDPLPVVEEAMRRYGVRWLALESAHIVESLVPVLTGETRPAWLSDPIVVVPSGGTGGLERSVSGHPRSTGAARGPVRRLPGPGRRAVCPMTPASSRAADRQSGTDAPPSDSWRAWLAPVVLFLIAAAVRLAVAAVVPFPATEGSAYYVGVARHILAGDGLVTDSLWSYATPPMSVPRPAFELWMPMSSFVAATGMALLGPTWWAAQVASCVLGALLAPLTWGVARAAAEAAGLDRRRAGAVAIASGLLVALASPFVLAAAVPDSYTPYVVASVAAAALVPGVVSAQRAPHRPWARARCPARAGVPRAPGGRLARSRGGRRDVGRGPCARS